MVTSTQRGHVISFGVDLVTEICCNCGVLFAMPIDFKQTRRDDGKEFHCPAGHPQIYTQSNVEKIKELERKLLRQRAETDQAWARAEENRKAITAEERRHAATKGQLTKTRKRVAAGVCAHCHRTFSNVAEHMQTEHPDEVAEAGVPVTKTRAPS